MTFPEEGETPLAALEREKSLAREQTITDLFLHPVIMHPRPSVLEEIPLLLERGCNTIKLFTVFPWFDANLGDFLKAVTIAARNGLLTLIHCEDATLIEEATKRLIGEGKKSLRYYSDSRPIQSEVVATQRAISFAEIAGAPINIVHLSSRRALEVCVEAQQRGLQVYVETRPLYLFLTRERFEEAEGAKYLGQPPLRQREDVDSLWEGIDRGSIHTVATDHAPWSLEAKLSPDHTLQNLRPGVENLQTMLPMLYSEGVRRGRISLERFVEVTSTHAAKLYGLYPRKGKIAVGSDADLVLFDRELTRSIDNDMLLSNADYSVYEGWEVTGWPVVTIRRGEIVYQDGEVLGTPGSGQLIRRGVTQPI
jgi:dihydropyrimidinase